jgi:hypothetical protein
MDQINEKFWLQVLYPPRSEERNSDERTMGAGVK